VIDITGVDLVKFAQKVYELSFPQGMGFLHFTPTPLAEEEAKEIVERAAKYGGYGGVKLDMDYVAGRACKMIVWEKDGRLVMTDSWYDHTDDQLKALLAAFDIELNAASEHRCACNCANCRVKHPQPA
jgi:hypothetical protein